MDQAVSLRPLTAKMRVRSQAIVCEICGGRSGIGTGFASSTSTSVFSCQYHAPYHLNLYVALTRRRNS
jgi:hypothetical protein